MSKMITPAQRATILSIELKIGEVFTGTNRRQAGQFIDKYWNQLVSTPSKLRSPSKNQMIKIGSLETVGCPEFTGNTYESALEYIKRNTELANTITEYWRSSQ